MARKRIRILDPLVLLPLVLLAGCGGASSGGHPVHGRVNFNGMPLSEGVISFLPMNDGTAASANIREGNFQLLAEQGLTTGKYRVEIKANLKTGKKIPGIGDGGMTDEIKQIIPVRYNQNSELEVEVQPSVSNQFEFHLEDKARP